MDVLTSVLGLILLALTTSSVIRTLIVPRGLTSVISWAVATGVVRGLHLFSNRMRAYRARDALLAWVAPLTILGLLVTWLALYWLSYALLMFPGERSGISQAFRESGSSLFTLGYATGSGAPLTFLDFCAAATGPIVIGLMIGYLPTLYSSFSRREANVTQLGWAAGEPNWGPELLARLWALGQFDDLPDIWASWTAWAAEVSESHITYPVLITVRSTRSRRNWVVALVAVMDAAALQMALTPDYPQGRARSVLNQGEQCLKSIAEVLGSQLDVPHRVPHKGSVTREDFDRAVERLRAAGMPLEVDPDEAWPVFRQWRDRYEGVAYLLCRAVDAVPSWWTGPRTPATEPVPTPRLGEVPVAGPAKVQPVNHREYGASHERRREHQQRLRFLIRRRKRGRR